MRSCLTPYLLTPWFDADGEENPRSKWSDTGRKKPTLQKEGRADHELSSSRQDVVTIDEALAVITRAWKAHLPQ